MLAIMLTISVMGQTGTPSWKDVDALVSQDKYEAAAATVEKRLSAARASGDQAEQAKALVKLTSLRGALGGIETAVKRLRDEQWPTALVPHTLVELAYAQALTVYLEAYSWEISHREKVDSKGELDLKRWTSEQIFSEANRAYEELWKVREQLGLQPLGALSDALEPNTYPPGVRGTLRDVVTYLRVRHLANTRWWTPEHSNGTWQLGFKALVAGQGPVSSSLSLADESIHPLVRVGAMLADLERWHRAQGHVEAALFARLQRLQVLRVSFTSDEERAAVIAELEASIASARALPFSAWARGSLAEWIMDTGDLARARDAASAGAKAFPQSVGGQRCRALVAALEAPDFNLQAMLSDGVGHRSIEITHKNLKALHFRAYQVDPVQVLSARGYQAMPQPDAMRALVSRKADFSWSQELPGTPDLAMHRTSVTPPMTANGLYVVIASANPDFGDRANRLSGVSLYLTQLVLTVKQVSPDSSAEVLVRDGATGVPVAGAEVQLWGGNWSVARKVLEVQHSNAAGLATFKGRPRTDLNFLFAAKKGADFVVDQSNVSFNPQGHALVDASLIYTDRSIYRPQQQVQWKVVGYHGSADTGRYQVTPNAPVTVRLMDPNAQEVASQVVTTNSFGSASGVFTIPTGRLLGAWRVESRNASVTVRVEEYKRPTFEVAFKEPAGALKLNAPATLTGEARYVFGLPVSSGKVRWRVQRTPVFPWWWWGGVSQAPQVVGSGAAALKEDGSFSLTFLPVADPKLSKDVSYRYAVEADVTDEGGETRSASKSVRLGQVSVQATYQLDVGFFREGQPVEVPIVRTDLNGAPRPGKGTWRLVALAQPTAPLLPADEPPRRAPNAKRPAFQTAGDEVQPRWIAEYNPRSTLSAWSDGAEQAHGALTHDAGGLAKVVIPRLAAGAWRLRYQTQDDFGATWEMATELLVAGPSKLPAQLPALARLEEHQVAVGGTARLIIGSAFVGQPLLLEIFRDNRVVERRWLAAGKDSPLFERKVTAADRGGFAVQVSAVRDWQLMRFTEQVNVPYDDKQLEVEFSTFRDLLRPGARETFKVTVKGKGKALEAGAAEVLAYMYDQSLDLFGPHAPPSVMALYPSRASAPYGNQSLGVGWAETLSTAEWYRLPERPALRDDRLKFDSGLGVGGMGTRVLGGRGGPVALRALSEGNGETVPPGVAVEKKAMLGAMEMKDKDAPEEPPPQVRSNFSESAFFYPHLVVDGAGSVSFEFQVPDSVTAWNVWAHAVTRDLRGGSTQKRTRSVKDLMVRPYLPRFLREGDQAAVKVVVNNASQSDLSGELLFDVIDPQTQKSVLAEFGGTAAPRAFSAKAGQGATLTFPLTAPKRVGQVAVRVVAKSGALSDGELRPLPLLPSRLHLAQSRFAALKDQDSRTLSFDDLAKSDHPTRLNEQLVVTIDAQLIYSVLSALPYLTRSPYECTEQTMNRFLSTSVVGGVFRDFPAIAAVAKQLSSRKTALETFDSLDPNRKLALEESPWLLEAKGGGQDPQGDQDPINMLDARLVAAERASALAKLQTAQTDEGGFPWFPGGPPSPYLTLYLLQGFSRAVELKVDVPKPLIVRAWQYVGQHYHSQVQGCLKQGTCSWEFVTFMNQVASAYPDESWLGGALTQPERAELLDASFAHWRQHSPYLKGYLALTLKRAKRDADAKLVFDSVMDSAKTTQDEGTFWQPEDRSWLWYHDTIESHAFALRTLTELAPRDPRRAGLVQWLLLNKKLSHWKSTRATAEVIYALVKYLEAEQQLWVREESKVVVGPIVKTFVFEPDRYTGKGNHLVIEGQRLDPKTMSQVTISKTTKGLQFASATWHFSTDALPKEARGDFFGVSRAYFKRVKSGPRVALQPLQEGAKLEPGDELEVQLAIRSKQAAEYVHLRDPRGAGFEPEQAVSRYRRDLGLGWYEEYRDSGTNFFFESLPAGEYTLTYRVRANLGGTFRVGPATLQSMYAPEFTAYSAGSALTVATGGE